MNTLARLAHAIWPCPDCVARQARIDEHQAEWQHLTGATHTTSGATTTSGNMRLVPPTERPGA